MFSLAAHELTQPLASALGAATILSQSHDKLDEGDRRWLTDAVIRNLQQLNSLLSSMAVYGSVEAGALPIARERVQLVSLFEAITKDAAGTFASRKIDFECDEDTVVEVDAVLLRQVLFNLVNNAKKFSPVGSEIKIRGHRHNGEIRVSIHNTGVGFAEGDGERIFEKAVRLDHHISGLGIGLYISKAIVEAHGGRIWADSSPDEGATFSFAVPA